jgi:hypothetical protein
MSGVVVGKLDHNVPQSTRASIFGLVVLSFVQKDSPRKGTGGAHILNPVPRE